MANLKIYLETTGADSRVVLGDEPVDGILSIRVREVSGQSGPIVVDMTVHPDLVYIHPLLTHFRLSWRAALRSRLVRRWWSIVNPIREWLRK